MKSKSSSLFRSIESNGYFSIIEANIIQYYHSRFKIATIIREKCEDQTVSLDILISVVAKWCIYLDQTFDSQNVCCADRLSSIDALRGQCY